MKVWIVEYANYDEGGFVGAYSTEAKAKEAVENILHKIYEVTHNADKIEDLRTSYMVFEHELDTENLEVKSTQEVLPEELDRTHEAPWGD